METSGSVARARVRVKCAVTFRDSEVGARMITFYSPPTPFPPNFLQRCIGDV